MSLYHFLRLHPEPPAPAAATAAVAQQVEQDHAPAPAHQSAGLGVSGLGAVSLAGVLQIAQVHLVLGIIRVQLGGAAGVLQGVDAVAQALVGQRGEVIPAGVPGWKKLCSAYLRQWRQSACVGNG